MKKIVFIIIGLLIIVSTFVWSRSKKTQIVDVYVCDVGLVSAEINAKAQVSRKDLYIVGYCKCNGVNKDMMSYVRDHKKNCDPDKHMVYSCVCIGKSGY